jgi:hypothetical protein
MATTTTREGMRKALDALRIGRPADIAAVDFTLDAMFDAPPKTVGGRLDWSEYGVLQGDHVQWVMDDRSAALSVRIILREEAPTFVDLMAA